MQPVFSTNGQHVAWINGNYVYDVSGNAIAYTSDDGIYALNSAKYIGQIENGEAFIWREDIEEHL
ncbi:4-fold beta flower protein [Anaerosinus massiliensis]|uniref:4-fold beta flower protein n=1 Tax=Massilibacillus massiliensis TaxID=1806837 RepID=UPI000DA5F3CA|nr:hypothetical protein [Massilibacillus massiliensis]